MKLLELRAPHCDRLDRLVRASIALRDVELLELRAAFGIGLDRFVCFLCKELTLK